MIKLPLHDKYAEYKGTLYDNDYPTISAVFYMNSLLFPNNVCFEEFYPVEKKYTYSESFSIIKKIALKLKQVGVKKNDKVALCGLNSCAWGLCFYAINAAGVIVVPIDSLSSKRESENIVNMAGVHFAFVDVKKRDSISNVASENVVYLDNDTDIAEKSIPNLFDWISDVDPNQDLVLPKDDRELTCILFTSGTTGVPKGVMLTNRNLMANVAMTVDRFHVSQSDVSYAILPLHHAYALMATFLVLTNIGGKVVFGKKMVSQQMFSDVGKGNVSIFLGVPLLYTKILMGINSNIRKRGVFTRCLVKIMLLISHFFRFGLHINIGKKFFGKVLRAISFDKMRVCICGGGPLAEKTYKAFLDYGIEFMQGYGMTETSPIISLVPLGSNNCKSVGKILNGITAEIRQKDSDGNGTLFVKGDNCMQGYYEDPESTKEILTNDGFINTGDVGYLDKKNYFYITGRKKNIIVTDGGKNVFPEEIEEEFANSHSVGQVVITGYKLNHDNINEHIRAVIYPTQELLDKTQNDFVMAKDVISKEVLLVNKRLRPYKRIEDIKIVKEPFEITTTKKIKRSCVERLLGNAI